MGYFYGQIPQPCGCYHPDCVCLGYDASASKFVYHCIKCGDIQVKATYKPGCSVIRKIPSDKWREGERKRLRRFPSGRVETIQCACGGTKRVFVSSRASFSG